MGFKPTMVLRAEKKVHKIWALPRVTFELKRLGIPVKLHSEDEDQIDIWP
jgi:hypothetical protein